jgi:ABC-type multidrug transport system ATPase subunit
VVAFEHRLRTTWNSEALDRWCSSERLDGKNRVGHLSKGQRKRLEIELALAGRPDLLLLDEPFANLDPVAKNEALGMLLDHVAETGATILLSSHQLSDLERVCDQVGILTEGRISIVVALDELKETGAIVTRFDGTEEKQLPSELRVLASWRDENGLTSVVTGLDDGQRKALAGDGFRVRTGNLKEIGTELLRVHAAR